MRFFACAVLAFGAWSNIATANYGESEQHHTTEVVTSTEEFFGTAMNDGMPDGVMPIWHDEFDGNSLNTNVWSFSTGTADAGVDELQTFSSSSSNVYVQDGKLNIALQKSGNTITSGQVLSKNAMHYRYGTLIANISFPSGAFAAGIQPKLFTLGESYPEERPRPDCGEFDVFAAGGDNSCVSGTRFILAQQPDSDFGTFTSASSLADSYHLYRMDWTRDYVRFYVDGNLFHSQDISLANCHGCSELRTLQFPLFSMIAGGPGARMANGQLRTVNDISASSPIVMQCDWIRLYGNSDTNTAGSFFVDNSGGGGAGSGSGGEGSGGSTGGGSSGGDNGMGGGSTDGGLGTITGAFVPAPGANIVPIWRDEFEGNTLNSNYWSVSSGMDMVGPGELQTYSASQQYVFVRDGRLQIRLNRVGSSFTSGQVFSKETMQWRYGTLMANISFPDVEEGLQPKFWTLGSNYPEVPNPQSGEFQIASLGDGESLVLGEGNSRAVSGTRFQLGQEAFQNLQAFSSSRDLVGSFHIYRMEWTPQTVQYYIDDNLFFTQDISIDTCHGCSELRQKHFVLFSMIAGGRYTTRPGDSLRTVSGVSASVPAVMQVEWIRLYENDYTSRSGIAFSSGSGPVPPPAPATTAAPPPPATTTTTVPPPPPPPTTTTTTTTTTTPPPPTTTTTTTTTAPPPPPPPPPTTTTTTTTTETSDNDNGMGGGGTNGGFGTIEGTFVPAPGANVVPIWRDEFEGTTLNSNYWTISTGTGMVGPNELQTYSSNSRYVFVRNGRLQIRLDRQNNGFTSGQVISKEAVQWRYGTLMANISFPDVEEGLQPKFWTLGSNYPEVPNPQSGEFQIASIGDGESLALGEGNSRVVSGTRFQLGQEPFQNLQAFSSSQDVAGSYHIYRMEWTPQTVQYYVDDNLFFTQDISIDTCHGCSELRQQHFVLFSMIAGGRYTTRPGDSLRTVSDVSASVPAVMRVEWVRLYENDFTTRSGTAFTSGGATGPAPSPSPPSPTPPTPPVSVDPLPSPLPPPPTPPATTTTTPPPPTTTTTTTTTAPPPPPATTTTTTTARPPTPPPPTPPAPTPPAPVPAPVARPTARPTFPAAPSDFVLPGQPSPNQPTSPGQTTGGSTTDEECSGKSKSGTSSSSSKSRSSSSSGSSSSCSKAGKSKSASKKSSTLEFSQNEETVSSSAIATTLSLVAALVAMIVPAIF